MNLKTVKYLGVSLLATLFAAGSALAQSSTPDFTTMRTVSQPNPIASLVRLLLFALFVAGLWKTLMKTGGQGWPAIIPFYNFYVRLKLTGRSGWWLILYCIPIFNLFILIPVGVGMAKLFGKGTGFGIGLGLLGFIFYPILGFGSATYQGSAPPQP